VGPAPTTTTREVDLSMTISRGGRCSGAETVPGKLHQPAAK